MTEEEKHELEQKALREAHAEFKGMIQGAVRNLDIPLVARPLVSKFLTEETLEALWTANKKLFRKHNLLHYEEGAE